MKMKWFDRVLLALVLIIFIGVGVFAIGIALGPLRPVFESFYALMTNGLLAYVLILSAVGLVMLLAAIRVLYASCAHKGAPVPTTVLLKTTDNGSIRIAVSAIDSMVQRAARSAPSVRDVTTRILVLENDALAFQLRVTFAPDAMLSEATTQVQSDVKDYVEAHAGVPVQEVQVFVEAMGNGVAIRVE